MPFELANRLTAVSWMGLVLLVITSGCLSNPSVPAPADPDPAGVPADAAQTTTTSPSGRSDATETSTTTDGTTSASGTSTTVSLPESPTSTTTTAVPEDAVWSLPPGMASEVLELMTAVEALRGREFLARPPVEVVTEGERATPSAPRSGWLSPEYLERQLLLLDFLGMSSDEVGMEEIVGTLESTAYEPFFDFGRRTIVLPATVGPLDEYQRWVLVGELAHALTVQHDPAVVARLASAGDDHDTAAALTALVEGEAALVQSLYLDSLPPERRSEVARQAAERPRTSLDGLPSMLRELLLFPYREGAFLAVNLYRLGGTEALDRALDRPPGTTEHILHLDSYRNLEPSLEVQPLTVTAEGYVLVEQGTWGEHRWRALFDHYSGPQEASRAAEGWGGDHYQMHRHPITDDLVFVARYVGDSFADEAEMNAAIRTMLSSGIEAGPSEVVDTITEWEGGTDYALLSWDIDSITLIVASDPIAGRTVALQLGIST